MPRLEPRPIDVSDAPAREVFALLAGDGRSPSPLYRTLAHSPPILKAWAAMARPLRSSTSVSGAIRELIILKIAQETHADYAWAYHVPEALRSGVSPQQLAALESWESGPAFNSRERAVLAYVEQVTAMAVDDETYRSLTTQFAEQEVIEITVIASFYACVARVLQALQIEVDPQFKPFLPASTETGR